MDSNNLFLQDSLNPQKTFNISKYYEFAYNTKLSDLDDKDLRNVEDIMHIHEARTQQAIFEEAYLMKKSPTLAILGVVLSELNQRQ